MNFSALFILQYNSCWVKQPRSKDPKSSKLSQTRPFSNPLSTHFSHSRISATMPILEILQIILVIFTLIVVYTPMIVLAILSVKLCNYFCDPHHADTNPFDFILNIVFRGSSPARVSPAPKALQDLHLMNQKLVHQLQNPQVHYFDKTVASAPVASAPVASAPVASAPVASAPVASVPVASVPVASVPVASVPVQHGKYEADDDDFTNVVAVQEIDARYAGRSYLNDGSSSSGSDDYVASAPVASAPVASAPVASALSDSDKVAIANMAIVEYLNNKSYSSAADQPIEKELVDVSNLKCAMIVNGIVYERASEYDQPYRAPAPVDTLAHVKAVVNIINNSINRLCVPNRISFPAMQLPPPESAVVPPPPVSLPKPRYVFPQTMHECDECYVCQPPSKDLTHDELCAYYAERYGKVCENLSVVYRA